MFCGYFFIEKWIVFFDSNLAKNSDLEECKHKKTSREIS